MDERMKELTQRLEDGVKEVFDSGRWAEYLTVMSRFTRYSFRNTLLIYLQNPDATRVAGFGTWKQLGRSVNKGERGLQILAPAPYEKTVEVTQDKEGNPLPKPEKKKVTVTAFKPVHVFDVSQTNGKELPDIATKLTGSVEEFDKLLQTLREVSPCPILVDEIDGTANGYYDPSDNIIVIKTGLSQEQTIKTMIHEIAHAMLGHGNDDTIDRRTGEVQAESVAFITCQHLCIDSSQYTFGYLASWSGSKELPALTASLETIQKTSSELIARIDDKLDKQRELEPIQEPQTVCIERFVYQSDEPLAEVLSNGNTELYRVQLEGDKYYIVPPSGRVDLSSTDAERYKEWHGRLVEKQAQLLRVPGLTIDERLRAARAVSATMNEAKPQKHDRSNDITR